MKLTTQSRYGVRAIFDIAYHSEGLDTQVNDISRRQGISSRYIEQIFQKLRKGKIIGSRITTTGARSRYFLHFRKHSTKPVAPQARYPALPPVRA